MSLKLPHDPTRPGPIAPATVRLAAALVDESGLVTALENWQRADARYRGGRPPKLSFRQTLILWTILALEQQPMYLVAITELLYTRLTHRKARAALELSYEPQVSPEAHYDRAQRATRRILDLIDDRPLPNRRRRLTKKEYREALEDRDERADELGEKKRRRIQLQNYLMEATYQRLPAAARTTAISTAIDATAFPLFARGIGGEKLAKFGDDDKISIEPDAGYYRRDHKEDEATGRTSSRKLSYAAEAELAILVSNDAARPNAVPHIVVALDFHKPSSAPQASAKGVFDNILERGHTLDHVTGDRLYFPGAKAEMLQKPLRKAGAKLVMSYKKDQLGQKKQKHGAIQVEGNWYCPSMPEELINATITRETGNNTDRKNDALSPSERRTRRAERAELWQARIAARRTYALRPKEKPDARGLYPMSCPAAGASPTLSCELKPRVSAPPSGRVLLPLLLPPKDPGIICNNKSSASFDIDDDDKYGQHYAYGSPEWAAYYAYARNANESYNGYIKDEATFNLAAPGRRRLRGMTAQAFLFTLGVAAANLQKIRDYVLEQIEAEVSSENPGASRQPAPEARRRRSRKSSPHMRLEHRNREARHKKKHPQRN